MTMLSTLLVAATASVGLAGSACFPTAANGPTVCMTWASSANETTINLTCDPGTSTLGKYLNWCGIGVNNANTGAMYPAEAWLLLPALSGNSLTVENRFAKAHALPLCFPTQYMNVLNSSITQSSSGGYVLQASWSRPRFLEDPSVEAEGHQNLTTGSTQMIVAASQAPYTAYTPCSNNTLEYHSWFYAGTHINWDM